MDTQTITKNCQACAYWNGASSEKGECRRHAPQNIVFKVNEEVSVESRFPTTSASDWCGDYSAK